MAEQGLLSVQELVGRPVEGVPHGRPPFVPLHDAADHAHACVTEAGAHGRLLQPFRQLVYSLLGLILVATASRNSPEIRGEIEQKSRKRSEWLSQKLKKKKKKEQFFKIPVLKLAHRIAHQRHMQHVPRASGLRMPICRTSLVW